MADTTRTVPVLLANLFQDGQAAKSITAQRIRDLIVSLSPPETALVYASALSWDLDTVPIATVTLTGGVTITPSGGRNGESYQIAIKQDATGGRSVAFSGVTVRGTPPWLTTANAVNLVTVTKSGGVYYATVI